MLALWREVVSDVWVNHIVCIFTAKQIGLCLIDRKSWIFNSTIVINSNIYGKVEYKVLYCVNIPTSELRPHAHISSTFLSICAVLLFYGGRWFPGVLWNHVRFHKINYWLGVWFCYYELIRWTTTFHWSLTVIVWTNGNRLQPGYAPHRTCALSPVPELYCLTLYRPTRVILCSYVIIVTCIKSSLYYADFIFFFSKATFAGESNGKLPPQNLPRMQRTRAIPVAWLSSGLCPNRPKGLNTYNNNNNNNKATFINLGFEP